MATTIQIDGIGDVEVGDAFKSMSAPERDAYVDHLRQQVGAGKRSGFGNFASSQDEGTTQKVARSLLMGVPFSDRAMAGIQTLHDRLAGSGKDYAGNLADVRAANAALEEEHPVGSFFGSLVGGAALPVGALGAAGRVGGSLGQKALAAAAGGAALGGVQGVSNSPDLTNAGETAQHAALGATFGGALGGMIPVAGAGAGKVIGAVAARRAPGADGLSREATNLLAKSMQADTPQALRSEAARLGNEAMLADLGSAMLGRTQGAALASDEARARINNALKARSAEASNRILESADKALGAAEPPRVVGEKLRNDKAFSDRVWYGRALGENGYTAEPQAVDTSRLISHIDAAIPRAEGDELRALKDLRASLFKLNPDLPENMPKASDYRVPMPSERVVGARDYARSLGGVRDEGGDLTSQGFHKVRGLVNRRGMPADKMREALAEQGYFDHLYGTPERATAESTPQDLFDVIEGNIRREADRGAEWQRDASRDQRAGRTQGEMWADLRRQAEQDTPPLTVPKTDPVNLHKIKLDLDTLISGQPAFSLGPGRFTRKEGAVMEARKLLNDILEGQVPAYLEANKASQGFNKRLEALDLGQKVLGSGPEAPWPQELSRSLSSMSPEEMAALKAGARGRIQEKLNRTVNDLTAGKALVQGDNDFNRANLGLIFGEGPTGQFVNRIEAEKKFGDTLNKVVENSQSAQRLAALRDMKPGAIDLPSSPRAGVKGAAVRVAEGLLSKFLPDRPKAAGEIAGVLTRQGKERDAAIESLAAWIADQELRRRGASVAGQRAAVGLLGPLLGQTSRGPFLGSQSQPLGLLGE